MELRKQMKQEDQQSGEQKYFTLLESSSSFIIECTQKKNFKIDSKLVINKKSQAIKLCGQDYIDDKIINVQQFDAILGVIQIQDFSFLLVVKEKTKVATLLQQHDVYEIQSVQFFKMSDQQITQKIKEYMEGVQQILQSNHYFSYTYPLDQSRYSINHPVEGEDIFTWNKKISSNFTLQNIDPIWIVKIIQGYVGQFKYTTNKQNINITLICRRSFKRGGTRYIHRGVDSDGYVANYCENEQIIESNEYIFSNILIRGSVPIFWEQVGVQAHLKLTRGDKLNEQAYGKHFDMLEKMYFQGLARGKIHIFNLMMQNDKYEQTLSDSFQANHLKYQTKYKQISQKENSMYDFFDFHKRANELDEYVYNIMHNTYDYGYYKEIKSKPILYQQQVCFFRVNCKDCLDRTNSFLMRIAFYQIEQILRQELGITIIDQNIEQQIHANKLFDTQDPLIQQLKQLWVENGNSISNLYAGTDSTTKKASSGFQYKLNAYLIGMKRFVNCNLNDSFKMECINLITCQHFDSFYEISEEIQEALYMKRDLFLQKQRIKIQILSWNVMSLVPQPQIQFKNFFDRNNEEKPDIIVVGLQEIVKVSKFKIQNFFSNNHDEKSAQLWAQIIQRHIHEQVDKNYMLISSSDMMGNFLQVYVNPLIKDSIKNVETETVKCGLAKKAADVGAVICRLGINETSVCFVHCFLPGGRNKKKVQQRFEAINHIHNTAFQKEKNGKTKTNKIDQSDLIFLFGDLNFRVDLEYDTANEMIQNYKYYLSQEQISDAVKQIQELVKKDQLIEYEQLKNQSYLKPYIEGIIQFPPNFVDRTKKKRTPSWRGRILYCLNDELSTINQRFYNTIQQSNESDHKPITSFFEISTQKIDQEKRNQIIQDLFKEKEISNEKQNDLS
ncbi:endonuclease/exonuclease/phosphatase family protein (macronuclear) [Tetrahymena thermophila SB210]|uniref:phosphoinositide 5-phosphatase n=1 Tax=Tetrahymena thermophila (strain SB210) TaxID=312017 RepID=I7MH96_TETTS|nr:endonuclease/exonuclease/phosphatase family protein [Tetrahymena thermophila SB210]EAS02726.2 endonuclease/exonuclease/phosphatase family protein [Tetrahymena thermophila SB210]|eukprot:XP_001022971.2 endonuclease/exonuclease/phosphatase family protein [Tetrahymena thermophila SB210]